MTGRHFTLTWRVTHEVRSKVLLFGFELGHLNQFVHIESSPLVSQRSCINSETEREGKTNLVCVDMMFLFCQVSAVSTASLNVTGGPVIT